MGSSSCAANWTRPKS